MRATVHHRTRSLFLAVSLVVAACPAVSGAQESPEAVRARAPRVTRTYDINDVLWGAAPWGSPDPEERTRRVLIKEFISLIADTVDPDTWKQNGGRDTDTIVEQDSRLVISASEENHRQISDLLRQLRETVDIQGPTLGLQFFVVDEPFVAEHAAAAAGDGPQAMTIGALTARQVALAAETTPGALSLSAPMTPLFYRTSAFALGQQRALKLPVLDGAPGRVAEVRWPGDVAVTLRSSACRGYVTLDLDVRVATFDARLDGGDDEIGAAYRGTITIELGGRFMLSAPLVRSRLAGVREVVGADHVARQQVVREPAPAAEQSDPRRFLVVLGAARGMTDEEITEIAGSGAIRYVRDRYGPPDPPPAPPPPPGAPPQPLPPPPPPPPARVSSSTRVYDVSGLLLGSEPEAERAAAREKRLKRVMQEVKAVLPEKTPLRELQGRLIITAPDTAHAPVPTLIDRMLADQLLPRK